MDDALVVRGVERVDDLPRDGECVGDGNRAAGPPAQAGHYICTACQALRQGLPVDELEDEEAPALGFFEAVDGGDVRVVERGEHLRLALEPGEPVGIVDERVWKDLDGDVAIELRVARLVDLAHPAGTQHGDDLVWTQACPCAQRHRSHRDGLGVNVFSLAAGPHPRGQQRRCLASASHGLGSAWPRALIPPAPSMATTSYDPSRVPAVSAISRTPNPESQIPIPSASVRRSCS